MADTNTYISKQKVEKWTTKEKFNALDLSDIPVGTEYNLTGDIGEGELDANLQAKIKKTDEIDQKSSVAPITSSPSEGSEVIRGVNINGTDYAFPNRYRHTVYLSGLVSTVISFDNDSNVGITDISEIPQFIHYPAYIYSGGKGVLDLYGDGSSYTISGCYVTDGGEVATISMSDMGINYQDTTDL